MFAFFQILIFYSCSNKVKKVQIMTMTGSIREAINPNEVEFKKGDSIVLVNFCDHKTNPCTTSIFGFYTGTLLPTEVIREGG